MAACKSVCGNNNAETGEQCDGTDLNGGSCGEFGFGSGTLCSGSAASAIPCEFDVSSRTP